MTTIEVIERLSEIYHMDNNDIKREIESLLDEYYSSRERLCFVKDNTAYFTNNLEEVTGDDWDDHPFIDNAGPPYEEYVTSTIMFREWYFHPNNIDKFLSADEIIKENIPWITRMDMKIHHGESKEEVIRKLIENDFKVYIEWRNGNDNNRRSK